jgi:hypothetical protein
LGVWLHHFARGIRLRAHESAQRLQNGESEATLVIRRPTGLSGSEL